MRKIILDLAVTLDGFIEGPNGEIDWLNVDGGGPGLLDFLKEIDTIIYGRISYDLWGQFNPGPEGSDFEQELWAAVHTKEKIVVSTGAPKDGRATWINEGLIEKLNALKALPGRDIWLYGGASLISTFMNLGLIDEYRLGVYPVILGAGKPLFIDIRNRVNLRLSKVTPSESGVVLLCYVPEGK